MTSLPDANLSEIPAAQPPPGTTSNFVDPQTLTPTIVAISIVMMTWALSFVIIRLYANFHRPRGLRIDDYFCVIATVLAVTYTGVLFSLHRFARHTFDIPLAWIDGAYYVKDSYASVLIIGPALFFAKSSIFLIYLHVFRINRTLKYGVWFGLLWTFCLYWSSIPVETYTSAPQIGQPWNVETINRRHNIALLYSVVQGALSVALDLYIFVLPIQMIIRLQMSLKRRLSILCVFGTAILGITAAVVSLVYRVRLYYTDDPYWTIASVYLCFVCEIYVAIIVASMPAFASFFNGTMPGALWLARMSSLLRKSKPKVSRKNIDLSLIPRPDTSAFKQHLVQSGHTCGDDYLELHETSYFRRPDCKSASSETASRTFEEGTMCKPAPTYQPAG